MTPDSVGPFSRSVDVRRLLVSGEDVEVTATPEECAALAKDFGLPAVHSLVGSFHLSGSPARVKATGRIGASIRQICVVSLEPFDLQMEEEVEVEFAEAELDVSLEADQDAALDRPDSIVDGHIDLGALAAEFLALGLDPYPRKPGSAFSYAASEEEEEARPSPFAALSALKPRA